MSEIIYCIDSCSLIGPMNETYPIDVFPGLWENMSSAFAKKIIISSEIVLAELEFQEDEVFKWAKARKEHFLKVDEAVGILSSEISNKYKGLIDPMATRDQADPFLIALAKIKKAKVVTEETWSNNIRKAKIPNACKGEGIDCVNFIQMVKELGWKFT